MDTFHFHYHSQIGASNADEKQKSIRIGDKIKRAITTWLLVAIGLAGCATNWQNTSITNPQLADKQFKIDDGYCIMVAAGSVPMPPMPAPQSDISTTTGQMTVTNMATGRTAFGTYTATTVPSPATSFANGVTSGLAMGAMFAAAADRDKIRDACMLRKGWMEAPHGAPHAAPASVATNKTSDTEKPNVSEALLCHIVLENGRDLGEIPVNIENGRIWTGIDPVWRPVDTSDQKLRWVYDLGSKMQQYAGQGILSGGQIEQDTGEYHEYLSNRRCQEFRVLRSVKNLS